MDELIMDELILANHSVDQLQGLIRRSSQDTCELLAVALAAAKNGRIEVTIERLEAAIDDLHRTVQKSESICNWLPTSKF